MTRSESKQQRLDKARLARAKTMSSVDPTDQNMALPPAAVLAEPANLSHNNTYSPLPRFYIDRVVVCRQCGTEEVWPAENQKHWYEDLKGNINTRAVLCRACRAAEKLRKDQARKASEAGLALKKKRDET